MIGYMFITKPSKQELEQIKHKQDSIAQVKRTQDSIFLAEQEKNNNPIVDSSSILAQQNINKEQQDSLIQANLDVKYGSFKQAAQGTERFYVIENNKMYVTISNKGGKIHSVQLKEYKTYYQDPLFLLANDTSNVFGLELVLDNKTIITNDMFFETNIDNDTIKIGDKEAQISMKLKASENKYIEFLYIIKPNDYMLDYNINFVGMDKDIENNQYITLRWETPISSLERGREWEANNTTIFMRMSNLDIENLNETKEEDSFDSRGSIQWIAYKQQFFSSILIAKNKLDNPTVKLFYYKDPQSKYLKRFESEFTLAKDGNENQNEFSFYFGPNKFSTLKQYDLKLEKVVPLGWGIFGWVNRFIVIPIFNWLGGFINNYGIIILLLTLIIKIVLFPLTYKSYLSTAKMKVLKPQVDALNDKYPKGKEVEKQQAVMALYKKTGVSPMGGCLPMLLQFPILIAMFRFFPASIELRQQSFLWANDLSTYDAIIEWNANIPLISSFYGNHVSLFTLLMAISMLISTWMSNSNQPTNNSMPGMKTMMYIMPLMMVFWFNKYSSGLSYYYFLANVITILQNLIIQKFFVNEKKVLAQLEANKKKVKTKSKWQQRLEDAVKQQQQRK